MKQLLIGTLVLSFAIFNAGCVSARRKSKLLKDEDVRTCTSAREYVTTLEYLRDHIDLVGTEKQARAVADKVSQGCTGAARRFIKTSEILRRAGLGINDIVDTATQLALKDDKTADSFAITFKSSFLAKRLDLDVGSSVDLAKSMSIKYEGDPSIGLSDFDKLVKYCVRSDKLDLPKPQCAKIAQKIAQLGQKRHSGTANQFITLFEYMIDDDGPSMATHEALAAAEEIVGFADQASVNFIVSYQYATAKGGLEMGRDQAFAFAKKIAKRSVIEPKSSKKK